MAEDSEERRQGHEAGGERLSAQLSAMLLELVQTPEVPLDGWSPEVREGGRIGRFELVRELGRGGFGVVYEARDAELSRTVALKLVKPGTRLSARGSEWLRREAEAVARLNHPNIVTLFDFGRGPTGPYLVLELLRGRTLAERLREGALPPAEVVRVGLSVSRALEHAHGAGVVHRDLSAANVFLVDGGVGASPATPRHGPSHPGPGTVKVLDFGLSHLFGKEGGGSGGTPAYMAPEQWRGEEGDARTDVYALGVILHQALSGAVPYDVTDRGSFALGAGSARPLPRRAGPAPLRRLIRRMVERDPSRRPGSAREVREALARIQRRAEGLWRRRLLGTSALLAALALLTAAWLLAAREPPPGDRVAVVMADVAPDPVLAAFPRLLAAALEPSPRVKLVGRGRLGAVAREAHLALPDRLSVATARDLARLAGAPVVLRPWERSDRGAVVLGVEGLEAESGRILFGVEERVGAEGLAGAVDALSDAVRKGLRERRADGRLRRPVAETVTASVEAARAYYEGVDCVDRPRFQTGDITRCEPAFERALALDPSFPLAHYQLARAHFLLGDVPESARPHLAAALAGVDRLPRREGAMVRAFEARLDGHDPEALRTYDTLLAADPDDAEVLWEASSLHARAGDWASAARYLEKLVQVVPDRDTPLALLIEALGRTGRVEALTTLRDRLQREGSGRVRAVVDACAWLGDHAAAVAAARRAADAADPDSLDTLQYALRLAGAFAEAEGVARKVMAATGTMGTRYAVETALAAQGRVNEALRMEEESVREGGADRVHGGFRRALIAGATGDPRLVWRHASQASATAPEFSADLAVLLLLLGDAAHAAELAKGLPRAGAAENQYQALLRWRAGDPAAAGALLAREEARDPWPTDGVAPAFLLAEVAAGSGDDVGTLAATDRFFRLPADRSFRLWAYPRALYLSALAHHRLGEDEAARGEVARLLALLTRADRSVRLVGQVRALEAALGRPGGGPRRPSSAPP